MNPFYKISKRQHLNDILPSLPQIKDILSLLNIPIYYKEGYVSEDIIGTLVKRFEDQYDHIYLINEDLNLGQILSDKISIRKPVVKEVEFWTKEILMNKWNLTSIKQVPDILSLLGYKVDDIPGIQGLGITMIKKLLAQYQTVENLIDNINDLKGNLYQKILRNTETILNSKKILVIDQDIDFNFSEYKCNEDYNIDELIKILSNLKLNRIIKNFNLNELKENQNNTHNTDFIYDTRKKYTIIQTENEFNSIKTKINKTKIVSINFSISDGCIDYICLSIEKGTACILSNNFLYNSKSVLEDISKIFKDEKIVKVVYNIYSIFPILSKYKITEIHNIFDIYVIYSIYSNKKYFDIETIASSLIRCELKYVENKDYDIFQNKIFVNTDFIFQIKDIFNDIIKSNHVKINYYTTELILIEILFDISNFKLNVNPQMISNLSDHFYIEIQRLSEEIFNMSHCVFNIDSPIHVSNVLNSKFNIKISNSLQTIQKYTSKQNLILSEMIDVHPIISKIIMYRHINFFKKIYIDFFSKIITTKNHSYCCSLLFTNFDTRKFFTMKPNLVNLFDTNDNVTFLIRKIFIPQPKNIMLTICYPNLKHEILFDLINDPVIENARNQKLDVYKFLSSSLFDVTYEEVDEEMINMIHDIINCIIHGFNNDLLDNTKLIESLVIFLDKFSNIKQFIDKFTNEYIKNSYIQTLQGRKIMNDTTPDNNYDLKSKVDLTSMYIVSSAIEIVKEFAVLIYSNDHFKQLQSNICFITNDKIILDVYNSEKEKVIKIIEKCKEFLTYKKFSNFVIFESESF